MKFFSLIACAAFAWCLTFCILGALALGMGVPTYPIGTAIIVSAILAVVSAIAAVFCATYDPQD